MGTKTYMAKTGEITPKWWLVDAEEKILGRMASDIAVILMGKHRPTYTPHVDTGDHIVVINAEKVMRRPDAIGLFRDFKVSGKPLILAARVQGTIQTAFPEGAPKNPKGPNEGKPAKGIPDLLSNEKRTSNSFNFADNPSPTNRPSQQ